MKIKYSVIPFIPAALAMLFFKLMGLVGVDGNGEFMGMNSMNITYLVIGIGVGLFVLCVILNLFDRKTAPVYPVKRNIPAGFLAMISAVGILASSLSAAAGAWANRGYVDNLMIILICAMLSIPAGIAMMLIARVHFSGKSNASSISVLFVFPSLWSCAELVNQFLLATKASISAKDLTSMFCFIFISLFLFSNSMIVSRIRGRNPVKGLFIYGLPMVAFTVSYGIYEIVRMTREGFNSNSLFTALMMIVLGLYGMSFIMELFSNPYTKEEIEIVDSLSSSEEEDISEGFATPVKGDFDMDTPRRRHSSHGKHRQHTKRATHEVLVDKEVQVPVGGFNDDLDYHPRDNTPVLTAPEMSKLDTVEVDEQGYDDTLIFSSHSDKDYKRKPVAPPPNAAETIEGFVLDVPDERDKRKKKDRIADDNYIDSGELNELQDYAIPEAKKEKPQRRRGKKTKNHHERRAPQKNTAPSVQDVSVDSDDFIAPAEDVPVRGFSDTVIFDDAYPEKNESAAPEPTEEKVKANKADEERKAEKAKRAEAARRAEEAKKAEAARKAEEAKKAEAARKAERAERAEAARKAAARKAEEAKRAEAARKAEEAKRAEAARKAEEAKRAEAARKAEEAKRAEAARRAEAAEKAEAPSQAEDKAEALRRAVEQKRAAEAARVERARMQEKSKADAQAAQQSSIDRREEDYLEKRSEVDRLLKELGNK